MSWRLEGARTPPWPAPRLHHADFSVASPLPFLVQCTTRLDGMLLCSNAQHIQGGMASSILPCMNAPHVEPCSFRLLFLPRGARACGFYRSTHPHLAPCGWLPQTKSLSMHIRPECTKVTHTARVVGHPGCVSSHTPGVVSRGRVFSSTTRLLIGRAKQRHPFLRNSVTTGKDKIRRATSTIATTARKGSLRRGLCGHLCTGCVRPPTHAVMG